MQQQIRFCHSTDGTRLAYADIGEGPPLICVFSWPTNLEMDWGRTESRTWLERIASRRRLVRFDRRGVGASERHPSDFSMEAHVSDVSAVADHLGLERFSLWGFADGAAVSVAYAAEYPERLTRLFSGQPTLAGKT